MNFILIVMIQKSNTTQLICFHLYNTISLLQLCFKL